MDHRRKCKRQNIKFLDDNMGEDLDDVGFSSDFS